jgi:ribonuclease HII
MSKRYVVGVDEVGRGPLAGPVTVGAVVMSHAAAKRLPKLRDSKRLSENGRKEVISRYLRNPGVRTSVASVSAAVIDEKGISRSLRVAVREALRRLRVDPRYCEVFLDGGLKAPENFTQKSFVKGDERIPIIAVASSLAKVHRDRLMERYGKIFPGYGFEQHAGYGTKAHYRAISSLGISKIHRKTFLS